MRASGVREHAPSPTRETHADAAGSARLNITRAEGGFQLVAEQSLPAPRDAVFAFFADAWQLEAITPAWLRFQVLTPRPCEIRQGSRLDYRLRLHGWPLKWRSLIRVWEPPVRFVDEQIQGPYRRWHHEHTFAKIPGGTLVRDTVSYQVPGGRLIHALLVRRDLERIFQHRAVVLAERFPPMAI